MWCSCDIHVMIMWQSMWCSRDTCVITMWRSCDAHVTIMWHQMWCSCDKSWADHVMVMWHQWWSCDDHVDIHVMIMWTSMWWSCGHPCDDHVDIHVMSMWHPCSKQVPLLYNWPSSWASPLDFCFAFVFEDFFPSWLFSVRLLFSLFVVVFHFHGNRSIWWCTACEGVIREERQCINSDGRWDPGAARFVFPYLVVVVDWLLL